MNPVDVTILCITYNHAKYIRDCLEGFVNQDTSYKYEIVIHDDASTDGTQDIIEEYLRKYPDLFIPILQKNNLYSRNISRQSFVDPLIHGRYIAFCEGDDYWIDPNKLQKQVSFLEYNPDYAMCVTSGIWHNESDNSDTEQFVVKENTELDIDDIIAERNGRLFSYNSIVVRREVYFFRPLWRESIKLGTLANSLAAEHFGKIMMLADVTCVYRYGTVGSWSKRIKNNEMRKKFAEQTIKGYREYNIETNFAHNEAVNYIINKHLLTLAVIERRLFSIIFGKNRSAYLRLSKKARVVTVLNCISPNLIDFYIKIKELFT